MSLLSISSSILVDMMCSCVWEELNGGVVSSLQVVVDVVEGSDVW